MTHEFCDNPYRYTGSGFEIKWGCDDPNKRTKTSEPAPHLPAIRVMRKLKEAQNKVVEQPEVPQITEYTVFSEQEITPFDPIK